MTPSDASVITTLCLSFHLHVHLSSFSKWQILFAVFFQEVVSKACDLFLQVNMHTIFLFSIRHSLRSYLKLLLLLCYHYCYVFKP